MSTPRRFGVEDFASYYIHPPTTDFNLSPPSYSPSPPLPLSASSFRSRRVKSKDNVTEDALFYQKIVLPDARLLSLGMEECGEHILGVPFLGHGQLEERLDSCEELLA